MGLNEVSDGQKKLKNEYGYTIESLYEKIKDVPFSFGSCHLEKVGKLDTISFDPTGRMVVYITVSPKAIQVATRLAAGTSTGLFMLKEIGLAMLTDAKAEDNAQSDRAVEEVYNVLNQLLLGGVATNQSAQNDHIKLYMRQAILSFNDSYSICTEDQTPVYQVDGNLVSLKYMVNRADGTPCMEIRKKLIAVMPEYTILQNGSEVAKLKKKLRLMRPEVLGTVGGRELQITGNLVGWNFTIAVDGTVIGAVDTVRLTWADCYSIEVRDEKMQDLVVSIAIIIDNMLSNQS